MSFMIAILASNIMLTSTYSLLKQNNIFIYLFKLLPRLAYSSDLLIDFLHTTDQRMCLLGTLKLKFNIKFLLSPKLP